MADFIPFNAEGVTIKAIVAIQNNDYVWEYLEALRFDEIEEYGRGMFYDTTSNRKKAIKLDYHEEIVNYLLAEGWRVAIELVKVPV